MEKWILHPSLFTLHLCYLFQCQFLDEALCLSVFLDDGEHIADVNANAALELGVEFQVARHSLPVAVERKTDEAALLVIHA